MTQPLKNEPPKNELQPIIIVRRCHAAEDGHHGGAWKIAFADFMTAMMALFLVLWLVNASDADTRKAVASYFNPVKLVDRERSRRGLGSPGGAKTDGDLKADDIAGPDPGDGEGTAPEQPEDAGETSEARYLREAETVMAEREAAALARPVPFETSLAAELRPDDPYAVETRGSPEPEEKVEPEPEIAADVAEALRDALPGDEGIVEAVQVEEVAGGTRIQVSDGRSFAMFDTGSFVPTGRAIVAVKAIAEVLARRKERVLVEGHTDSVPFRGDNDNWRLSTERAHAARLMLLRGGLSEARVGGVSGFAATRPLDAIPPQDARNRRIEIVLVRS